MKNLVIILLCAVISVGASVTTNKLMVIKPAKPKQSLVFCAYATEASTKIAGYIKAGWVCDKLTSGGSGSGNVVVIMVKY